MVFRVILYFGKWDRGGTGFALNTRMSLGDGMRILTGCSLFLLGVDAAGIPRANTNTVVIRYLTIGFLKNDWR